MIDETDVAQRISRLVRACKRTAEMMVRGTPVTDEIADHLDAVRDAACEVTGAEPRRYAELSTDTSAEWMQAELDMQTHCDGIQAHAAAAVLALAREPHDDTQEAALNYCEAQQLSARHLLQWHAAELHRMVVGLHRLLDADEPPTLAQIRAVRTGQQVFDHSLPPAEPRMDSLPDLRLPPAAPMTEEDVRGAAADVARELAHVVDPYPQPELGPTMCTGGTDA